MISYKYALALFNLAREYDAIDEILHDYETFVGALVSNTEWLSVMQSTEIKKEKKQQLIASLSDFHPVFLRFLYILLDQDVLSLYEQIFEQFRILARREQKIAYVRIITAKPLRVEQYNLIREELYSWITEKELEIEVIIDRRLIGGIRIVYEGQTIDRSFQSLLEELKETV